jgi:hypothetical protein
MRDSYSKMPCEYPSISPLNNECVDEREVTVRPILRRIYCMVFSVRKFAVLVVG